MGEIDSMLEQWIHNSIVRKKLRDLIAEAIQDAKPKLPKYIIEDNDYVDEDED